MGHGVSKGILRRKGGRSPAHLAATVVISGLAGLALTACQPGQTSQAGGAAAGSRTPQATRLVDRDVEAPEIFNLTDRALWDGRPSLGGVWVAAESARDPERVIIRNPENGKFVIGALFRREAFNPGPPLQISSDAAAALGLVAGQPATVSVTALRREEAPVPDPDATRPILAANEAVATTALPEGTATTAAAKAAAPVMAAPTEKQAAPAPAASPTPVAAGTLRAQIGLFSVEANATRAVAELAKVGITAQIRPETAKGKSYWAVTATGSGPRAAFLDKVKAAGFADAYLLSR